MENKLAAITPITEPSLARPVSEPIAPRQPAELATDAADLRLVIEETGGSYVYKTVDRRTGEIVAQFPREEILKLRDENDYQAGAVINASA